MKITEDQWVRIIRWYQDTSRDESVEALLAANHFSNAMEKIQALAGTAQSELEEINQAILDMTLEENVS